MRLESFLGPRVPTTEMDARRTTYLLPTLFMALAAVLLVVSIFTPYWKMTLHAPQYPKGLSVQAYVNRMVGDVREIDGLNHYIGMRPLGEAASLELSLSIAAIAVISLLVLGTIFVHTRWAALLALPAIFFPVVFLGDLAYWLRAFGHDLDPAAPLSSSIKPFTPPVLGEGKVGQFSTVAEPDIGLIVAAIASLVIIAGLYFHRRAYKPLVDAANETTEA
jgi:copper chaperone NosL